jgi:arabinogalactan endo-1,4-beta-galactosidase
LDKGNPNNKISVVVIYRFYIAAACCLFFTQVLNAQEYAIGADLSFMKQVEDNGYQFKENGEAKPGLRIFKDHGYNWNWFRRCTHTPGKR